MWQRKERSRLSYLEIKHGFLDLQRDLAILTLTNLSNSSVSARFLASLTSAAMVANYRNFGMSDMVNLRQMVVTYRSFGMSDMGNLMQ